MNTRYGWLISATFYLFCTDTSFAEATQTWTLTDTKQMNGISQHSRNDKIDQPDPGYTRREAHYDLPDVHLLDRDGNDIEFRQLIEYGGPVMVQFIFATCSTVCPVLSASFASAQHELDALGQDYRLISISIDPEQDTPEKLDHYARRFKAGKNWYFLTGASEDIAKISKAFDAQYNGNNKMYHKPLTFLLPRSGANWTRIEGLQSRNDIVREYKNLLELSAYSED